MYTSIDRIASDLILFDCTNAMHRKIIFDQLTQQEGDKIFNFLRNRRQYPLKLVPSIDLLDRADEISKAVYQHPMPYCLYLALAEQKNMPLITADRKFQDLVKIVHFSYFIR